MIELEEAQIAEVAGGFPIVRVVRAVKAGVEAGAEVAEDIMELGAQVHEAVCPH